MGEEGTDLRIAAVMVEAGNAASNASLTPNCGKAIWWLGISAACQRTARRLAGTPASKGETE